MKRRASRWVIASMLMMGGCGGVYEELAPAQKLRVTMLLTPDFVRVGQSEAQLEAFIASPTPGETFVTDIDLGVGLEVLAFDDAGCGFATPGGFDAEPYRLCLTVRVDEDAEQGERTAVLELETGSGPTVARSTFFVLRALQ